MAVINAGYLLRRRTLLEGCAASVAIVSPASAATSVRAVDDPNIDAVVKSLPGLAEPSVDGPLVDLLRAIDEAYTEGSIRIRVAPVERVYAEVSRGLADLGMPTLRINSNNVGLRYRLSRASLGTVNFVLYSHRERPLAKTDLAPEARGPRLQIEGPAYDWGFPVGRVHSIGSALRKIDLRRIDGLLWAQEEADRVLRDLGLRSIHRESFGDFDDVMLMPHTARGEFVDRAVSAAVEKLRASGPLQALYHRVHRSYQAWQP